MSIINEIDLSNTVLTTRSNRFNTSINVNDNVYDDFIESEKNLGEAQIVETYENDLYKWKPNHLLMSNFCVCSLSFRRQVVIKVGFFSLLLI